MWEDQLQKKPQNLNLLESKIYCRKLKLANKNNWRIPKYNELLTLIDYNKSNPVNIDKISYIKSQKYWTLSQNINNKNQYWYINFKDGNSSFEPKSKRKNLRCVRDISKKFDNFEKKINIVIDKKQNIMWQDNPEAIEHFETITMAKVYCETLILNGYIDWKMPNLKQLQSIIDITSKKIAIKKPFKYIKSERYWSNTQNILNNNRSWYVDFKTGKVDNTTNNKEQMVRCLRDIK